MTVAFLYPARSFSAACLCSPAPARHHQAAPSEPDFTPIFEFASFVVTQALEQAPGSAAGFLMFLLRSIGRYAIPQAEQGRE
ncbi:MAG: hypothetical protein WBN51_04745, partial [Gammaproteobacteria bacterium]